MAEFRNLVKGFVRAGEGVTEVAEHVHAPTHVTPKGPSHVPEPVHVGEEGTHLPDTAHHISEGTSGVGRREPIIVPHETKPVNIVNKAPVLDRWRSTGIKVGGGLVLAGAGYSTLKDDLTNVLQSLWNTGKKAEKGLEDTVLHLSEELHNLPTPRLPSLPGTSTAYAVAGTLVIVIGGSIAVYVATRQLRG